MRYIQLTEEERLFLEDLYRHGRKGVERRRSQCLLLSCRGHSVGELAHIFQVRYATVLDWLNGWEREGRQGVPVKAGWGRKSKLAGVDEHLIERCVQGHNRNLRAAVAALEQESGVRVSSKTLQRFLKTGPLQLPQDTPQSQSRSATRSASSRPASSSGSLRGCRRRAGWMFSTMTRAAFRSLPALRLAEEGGDGGSASWQGKAHQRGRLLLQSGRLCAPHAAAGLLPAAPDRALRQLLRGHQQEDGGGAGQRAGAPREGIRAESEAVAGAGSVSVLSAPLLP